MNAGIAGVSRMIERLDLASKRSSSLLIPVRSEGTSGFSEGRFVLEKDIEHRPNGASGDHNVSSAAPSHISSTAVVGRTEIPSCVQVSPSTKPPCFYLEVVYCNKLIDAVISRKS
jgi:E3 ubiquitin-protein ligase RHF